MRIDRQRALRRKAPAGNRCGSLASARSAVAPNEASAAAKAVVFKSNRVGREPIFAFMADKPLGLTAGPGVSRSPYLLPGPPQTVHFVRRKMMSRRTSPAGRIAPPGGFRAGFTTGRSPRMAKENLLAP